MTKLHISRIRKRGEPDWYDPQTDIRKIVPVVMLEVLDLHLLQYPEDSQEAKDLLYIRNCVEIFRIRILEDEARVSVQVGEFFKAIGCVSTSVRESWLCGCMTVLMSVYALFCRRDSAAEHNELRTIVEYGRLCALKDLLTADTWAIVERELHDRGSLLVQNRTDPSSAAVCHETGKMFEGLKELAARFINASGDQSWDAKADACDEQFLTPGVKSDTVNLALALAYPTYSHPTLDVELDQPDEG